LPERASKVQFDAVMRFLDDGPGMCLGARLDINPVLFGCDNPIVDGLQEGPWTEPSRGSSRGLRSVVVSWPPINGRVEHQSDVELTEDAFGHMYLDGLDTIGRPLRLPEECESIANLTSSSILTGHQGRY
jgi:hypothetical protein